MKTSRLPSPEGRPRSAESDLGFTEGGRWLNGDVIGIRLDQEADVSAGGLLAGRGGKIAALDRPVA